MYAIFLLLLFSNFNIFYLIIIIRLHTKSSLVTQFLKAVTQTAETHTKSAKPDTNYQPLTQFSISFSKRCEAFCILCAILGFVCKVLKKQGNVLKMCVSKLYYLLAILIRIYNSKYKYVEELDWSA